MKSSLLVIDDHPLVRIALVGQLRAIFRTQLDNLLSAQQLDTALPVLQANPQPWIVTLDLCMPGVRGLPAVRAVRACPHVKGLVVFSSLNAEVWSPQVLAAGADAFVPKAAEPGELTRVLERFLCPVPAPAGEPPQEARLTTRQAEVLRMVADGFPNKTIARDLGIAQMTVKIHVTQILRSLGASNRTDAARIARERGMLA